MTPFVYFRFTMFSHFRVYQHIEMLGLFLFNDALVVTRRTDKNFPFTRAVEHTYRFESSLALSRLRVRDIPESKCKWLIRMMNVLEDG